MNYSVRVIDALGGIKLNTYVFTLRSTNRTKDVKYSVEASTLTEAEDKAHAECGSLEILKGGYWSLIKVEKSYV